MPGGDKTSARVLASSNRERPAPMGLMRFPRARCRFVSSTARWRKRWSIDAIVAITEPAGPATTQRDSGGICRDADGDGVDRPRRFT